MSEEEYDSHEFRISVESWNALIAAASDLEEMLREDVESLRGGAPVGETALSDLMPRRFIPKYDVAFADRLTQTATVLGRRLEKYQAQGRGYPHATFLNSVAEEMLMSQIIRMAIDRSDSDQQAKELDALEELTFEDRDFEWLYDLSQDGVTDDPEVAAKAGFANLKFDEWFEPFR